MFGFGTLQLLSGFIYGMMGVCAYGCWWLFGRAGEFFCFRAIEEAIEEGGLKLIVLLRLAPYPYAVMNGLLATTSTSFRNYALATLVAMLKAPLNVYIGTTLQNIADLISGRGGAPAPVEMGIMITGFVVAFVGLVYFSWLIRRMLKRYEEREEVVVETSRVERGESEGTLEEGEEESVGDEEKVVDVVTVK
ncbi:hypothetical protein BC829DRAFT_405836 [Chytridium lagenaria]|nr:hypothetical protein BC829DRAFT_405836 [Chytridium lagenaria]